MKRHEVTFTWYGGNEQANDSFHFSSQEAAQEKFDELRDVIEHNFADCSTVEIVDEDDFFGIRDTVTGAFAKVTIDEV